MSKRQHGITLRLTGDEALVLSELLTRYQFTSKLTLLHPSEYLSLMSLSKKLDTTLVQQTEGDYQANLAAAQTQLARGFEGEVPGLHYGG